MYGNIEAIHNFFKKHYIAKFSTSSIFKKIGKDNFEKKLKKKLKNKKKKEEVNFRGKKRKNKCKKKKAKKQRKKTCGES